MIVFHSIDMPGTAEKTQSVARVNLVNPSIPKMEVLDACFENCIKENVFQKYKMTIYLNV